MIPLRGLTASLEGLIHLTVPARDVAIDDLTLLEADRGVRGVAGDLLLGVGVGDVDQACDLLGTLREAGVRALLVRQDLALDERVQTAARSAEVALLGLDEHASWAHTVWLLRGLLDRTLGSGAVPRSPMEDLYAIADAAAALVDGSITIEDARSRVLAYSERQDSADTARVSTIVGRRVPEAVLSHLRARGVFRRMLSSPEPFFLPPSSGSLVGARMVVPVHAGGEWLGSLWAVVDRPTSPDVTAGLERTASIVALHLLQLRSQAVLTRRLAMDRLRDALAGTLPEADAQRWLPPAPWRVVALSSAAKEAADPARQLDLWEAILRRESWHQPQLVDAVDHTLALVRDLPDAPPGGRAPTGSWGWLAALTTRLAADGVPVTASAGRAVSQPGDLPRSLTDALLVVRARGDSPSAPAAMDLDDAWVQITTLLATAALQELPAPGATARLVHSDRRDNTAYLATLAAWLDHPGATTEAARRLGIHPNTLRHRMARITELIGADLEDPQTRLALRLHVDLHTRTH